MINLADGNDVYAWLWYEILLEAIHDAFYADIDYTRLLAFSRQCNGKIITQPFIKTENIKQSHGKGKEVPKGVAFKEDYIEVGDKRKDFKDYGKALKIPYNDIQDTPIDILAEFLVDYLKVISIGKAEDAIDTLVNGDGAVDSKGDPVDSSACVIGIKTPGTLTFFDIKKACIRLSRLKRNANIMVGSEFDLTDYSEMDEFKVPRIGQPIIPIKFNGKETIPRDWEISESSKLGNGKFMLLNTAYGVAEYVRQGLKLEKERLVSTRMIVVAFSERIAFMNRFRNSKVVVDTALDYTTNGFAPYLTPLVPSN